MRSARPTKSEVERARKDEEAAVEAGRELPSLKEVFRLPHPQALAFIIAKLDQEAYWDYGGNLGNDPEMGACYLAREILSFLRGGDGQPPPPPIPSKYTKLANELCHLASNQQASTRQAAIARALMRAFPENTQPRRRRS